MSLKALAYKVLAGNQVGNLEETTLRKEETLEETFGQKFPKKFPNSVARTEQNCKGCPYYNAGPTPDGQGVIHWCGPWRHANGDSHWLNIEELSECPLKIKRRMQRGTQDDNYSR